MPAGCGGAIKQLKGALEPATAAATAWLRRASHVRPPSAHTFRLGHAFSLILCHEGVSGRCCIKRGGATARGRALLSLLVLTGRLCHHPQRRSGVAAASSCVRTCSK